MARPTRDDKARRRAVKAARKVNKERAKQTRQNDAKEASDKPPLWKMIPCR